MYSANIVKSTLDIISREEGNKKCYNRNLEIKINDELCEYNDILIIFENLHTNFTSLVENSVIPKIQT